MTSPFALLFIAIQNRIKAITINSAPAFRFIDQDLMQLESHNGDDRPPVSWPACTIDIDDANLDELGRNVQKGVVKICIRLGFPPFSSSSSITPTPSRDKALYYYELEQAVYLALHGWTPGVVTIDDTPTTADLSDIFGALIRTAARTEKRNDRIRVRQLTFSISFDDYTAKKAITMTPATLDLTDQFIIPV